MKVWILSHLGETDGTRITERLLSRTGVGVRVVAPGALRLTIGTGETGFQHPEGLAVPDLVYTRLGASAPAVAVDVVRQLEMSGVTCVNNAASLEASRDKLRSLQLMARGGLPIPRSVLVGSRDDIDTIPDLLGPAPWVVKLPVGSKGAGVTLVESMRALRSLLDVLTSLGQRALVQRFVASSKGADTRVLVLDGRAVLAVRRQARGDEFRSNVHLGGDDLAATLDEEAASIAEQAARLHGLRVAGVDLLADDDGYVIAEVNASPGLAGPFRRAPAQLERAFHDFVERLAEENAR